MSRKKAIGSCSLRGDQKGVIITPFVRGQAKGQARCQVRDQNPLIKICGLTRPCDIDMVNLEKPEYIGFVFAKSRRQVTPAQAAMLRQRLAEGIIPVGVFVDEPIENILSLLREDVIGMVQLHGKEDEAYIQRLKELTDKPIIKAIAVEKAEDVKKRAKTVADYLLFDGPGGGTGQPFDWDLIPPERGIKEGKEEKPYFLAGGLNPGNAKEAIRRTGAFAMDVSSGVETNGLKDPIKIKEFIRRVRHE